MCCSLFGSVVHQRPHAVLDRELLIQIPNLGKNADFKTTHREQQVGVVSAINTGERIIPLNCCYGSRAVDSSGPRNTALPRLTSWRIKPHARIARPTFLVSYPMTFSKLGSGCSVKNRWMRSRDSSAVNRKNTQMRSMYLVYNRIGCLVSVLGSLEL
jgi:hypothetical protein